MSNIKGLCYYKTSLILDLLKPVLLLFFMKPRKESDRSEYFGLTNSAAVFMKTSRQPYSLGSQ